MMDKETIDQARVLRRFDQVTSPTPLNKPSSNPSQCGLGLMVPVLQDLEGKRIAMERIAAHPFVSDANLPQFKAAQEWVEQCGNQVDLPLNFCGGLLIMRLCRLLAPPSEQTETWTAAVHEAAAAYDFSFLALAHADDEADMTLARDGAPTRFVTHPGTRAVDGINLMLSGISSMQELLNRWPEALTKSDQTRAMRHPLAAEIMKGLICALKDASFPILLDRAGLGHTRDENGPPSNLTAIQVDEKSLSRVRAYTRHRAHTYFLRATELAVLLVGYDSIDSELGNALDELFGYLGSLGAAMDDLQDIFIDFSAGIHSVCTVMAHLCVAEDSSLRPVFRRAVPHDVVADQRKRLAEFFGAADEKLNNTALMALLDEIELRRALTDHFEEEGRHFAAAIYQAIVRFGFSAKLMMEIVSVVCRDPEFSVPDVFLSALEADLDDNVQSMMTVQVGKFVTMYFIERFWPKS